MRGTIEIDRVSGNVTECTLSQVEESATLSELSQQQIQQIGDCLTGILQDIATYMRQTGTTNF